MGFCGLLSVIGPAWKQLPLGKDAGGGVGKATSKSRRWFGSDVRFENSVINVGHWVTHCEGAFDAAGGST